MKSGTRAAAWPHGLPWAGAHGQSTPLNLPLCLYLQTCPQPSPPPAPSWARQRGRSSSFLMLSPDLAQSFLETASVSLGQWPLGACLWSQQSLPLLWQLGPPGLPPTPSPFSFDNSLTHPLLFQTEKKMEGWQDSLPPVPWWMGRSPPWAPSCPGRTRSPDN